MGLCVLQSLGCVWNGWAEVGNQGILHTMNRCILLIPQLYILDPIVTHINDKYSSFLLNLIHLLEVGMGGGGEYTYTLYIIVVLLGH